MHALDTPGVGVGVGVFQVETGRDALEKISKDIPELYRGHGILFYPLTISYKLY